MLTADRFVDKQTEIGYRIVNSRTEYFTEHTHDYAEIFIMLTGKARHTAGKTVQSLQAGDVVFIRPSDVHKYAKIRDEEFTFCNLTFTQSTLQSAFLYLGEGFPAAEMMQSEAPPCAHMDAHALKRFSERLNRLGGIAPEDAHRRKTALRILLMDILTAVFSDFSPPTEHIPVWLEQLCARMRTDGGFVEGSERMLALAGCTREHLARSMKKHLGITVSEFISDLRLNYIANMLLSSNKPISEIVFDSGFNTLSLATTRFKQKYGISMRLFREAQTIGAPRE
jgi:AraC family cel operon transcriptional repressor